MKKKNLTVQIPILNNDIEKIIVKPVKQVKHLKPLKPTKPQNINFTNINI